MTATDNVRLKPNSTGVELPNPKTEPTISVPRAGEILGLSRDGAYDAAARGEIPTLRFGRRLVVPTAHLLAMLGLGEQVGAV
ncbi:helix-turn-helix domain-containing protein [Sphaerisporangium sp. NPDC005288]|uniref:helix-turn-helix domain-containing protein n=1 Tax=Sphaerisporangium sp. NPDC005288 TaxID=3155114 RepID=UPI00339FCAC6